MNEKKWFGWWIITTPQEKEWATEHHEGDNYEKILSDAIATFGEGTTVKSDRHS